MNTELTSSPGKGFIGTLSDLALLPGGYRRAGRSDATAELLGTDRKFTTRHPVTAQLLNASAGGLLGGVGGGLIGNMVSDNDPQSTAQGATIGGLGGGLIGALLTGLARRRAMRETREEAEEVLGTGRSPRRRMETNALLSALVSGVHEQGRADTLEHSNDGRHSFEGNPVMSVLDATGRIPYVGALNAPALALGSVLNTGQARQRIRGANPQLMAMVGQS